MSDTDTMFKFLCPDWAKFHLTFFSYQTSCLLLLLRTLILS